MAETIANAPFGTASQPHTSEIVKAGIVAGLTGGVLMAIFAMIAGATYLEQDAWYIPRLIGATFFDPQTPLERPMIVLWGVVLHLIISAAFGVIFATLIRPATPPPMAVLVGIAFALGIFLLMTFLVVPLVNSVMASRVPTMMGTLLFMHLLYGLGLATAPTLRQTFASNARFPVGHLS